MSSNSNTDNNTREITLTVITAADLKKDRGCKCIKLYVMLIVILIIN